MSKRLMPTYLIKFLEEIFPNQRPASFGRRMVSRQFIARARYLYKLLYKENISDFGRRMVPEYLIQFFESINYAEMTIENFDYIISIAATALNYAQFMKIGGMSYKCNNLWDEEWEVGSIDNITGNNANVSQRIRSKNYIETTPNGIYYFEAPNTYSSIRVVCYDVNKTYLGSSLGWLSVNNNSTFTTPSNCYFIRFVIVKENETYDNDICINISNASINGNYYPYFTGIRDSAVSSVVSKDSNDTTLDTLTIDSNIQALNGYGWGINDTCYNYIDFENKKYIQKVGRVNLGTLDWSYSYSFYTILSNAKFIANTQNFLVSSKYKEQPYGTSLTTWLDSGDQIIGITSSNVRIKDTNFASTDTSGLKTSLNGVYLYYELATPVETDISDYIDSDMINVKANGTITFENEYDQAVPSEITFIIGV